MYVIWFKWIICMALKTSKDTPVTGTPGHRDTDAYLRSQWGCFVSLKSAAEASSFCSTGGSEQEHRTSGGAGTDTGSPTSKQRRALVPVDRFSGDPGGALPGVVYKLAPGQSGGARRAEQLVTDSTRLGPVSAHLSPTGNHALRSRDNTGSRCDCHAPLVVVSRCAYWSATRGKILHLGFSLLVNLEMFRLRCFHNVSSFGLVDGKHPQCTF